MSRRYRYRQRDEIVNVQGMIEDTHDKWLDQEEEYMQEQRESLKQHHLIRLIQLLFHCIIIDDFKITKYSNIDDT